MIIKCGHREFEVNETDRILFNGAVYLLITKRYFDGYFKAIPIISKTRFKKLYKEGKIMLTSERNKQLKDYPIYKFII